MKIFKYKKKFFFFIIFFFFLFLSLPHQQAKGLKDYTLLAPIPLNTELITKGTLTQKLSGVELFEKYIPGLFNLTIIFVAFLAVARIIYGGILYITTDAIQNKQDGKKYITESIWGILLVSVSWLILYTINPRLVNLNLSIKPSVIEDRFTEGEVGIGRAPTDSCTGCTLMVGFSNLSISNGANKYIEPDTFERLKILDKNIKRAGLTGTISEGYNPNGHQNSCHTNATCIDLNLPNENATNVKKIIDAAKNSGLRAIFEVESEKRKNDIIAGACGVATLNVACMDNMNKNIMVLEPRNGKRQITGEHFSVYNCQRDPQSCATFP